MVRKLLISLFLTGLFSLSAQAENRWTIDTARQEAFIGVLPIVDVSWEQCSDPYALQNGSRERLDDPDIDGRHLAFFDNGTYKVEYDEPSLKGKVYYYNTANAHLLAVEFINPAQYEPEPGEIRYPIKAYRHGYPSGRLKLVSILVGDCNSYVFFPNGRLAIHWIKGKGYDASGRVIDRADEQTAYEFAAPPLKNCDLYSDENWNTVRIPESLKSPYKQGPYHRPLNRDEFMQAY